MPVVGFERQKSIGHIVLANPPDNLLNIRFSECLQEAVHAAGDSDIRVLLIRAKAKTSAMAAIFSISSPAMQIHSERSSERASVLPRNRSIASPHRVRSARGGIWRGP